MNTQLPQPIATYMRATNARDTDAVLACFTADAVVTDEEQEYHGIAQTRAWREKTDEQYHYTVTVIDVTEGDNEMVVLTEVSGNFDGSPVQLHYHFTLKGDKISVLSIQG